MELLTARAVEGGTYVVPITAFYDEDDNAITPKTDIGWETYNRLGTLLGSGSVAAASSVDIVLTGAALAISSDEGDTGQVKLIISTTYDSTYGNDLVAKKVAMIEVDNDPGEG